MSDEKYKCLNSIVQCCESLLEISLRRILYKFNEIKFYQAKQNDVLLSFPPYILLLQGSSK